MPLTPRHRWKTFLICAALLSLGMGSGVVIDAENPTLLNDTQQRIITTSLILVAVLGVLIRQEVQMNKVEAVDEKVEARADKVEENLKIAAEKQREDIRHDVRGELTPVVLQIGEKGALTKTVESTHKLVDGGMTIQLRLNAELSRWKADQTKKPADIEAAEQAERLYREHLEKEAAAKEKA